MRDSPRPEVSWFDKFAYGAGNLATGASMQNVSAYLMFYATAILGLPGAAVGLVMGLSIFWDAVTDPPMGYVSDRTPHGGLGRRHPYLLIGAVGMALVLYLIWTIDPSLGAGARLALLTAFVLLFKTFTTVYTTPYTALGAELSTDYNERTAIQGVKTVFFVLGIASVSVAGLFWFFRPTPEYAQGQLNPAAYSAMGTATAILVLLSAAASFLPTLKYLPAIRARDEAAAPPGGFSASLARAFRNKPYRMVVLAYMFSNLASALLTSLGMHVFTYTFGLGSGQISLMLATQLGCAILSQPFWAAESRRLGKRAALISGFVLSIVGSLYFVALVLIHPAVSGNVWVFLPFAVTAGSGIGALFTLPLSMVADTVDLDEAEGGSRIEGTYYGALTLVYKLSQALALSMIGLVLDGAGFDRDLAGQSYRTVMILGLTLGFGCLASFGLAVFQLRAYRLDEAAVADCRRRIAAGRADRADRADRARNAAPPTAAAPGTDA
jgi:Na+/melibiose symporter-like transporter